MRTFLRKVNISAQVSYLKYLYYIPAKEQFSISSPLPKW